MSNTQGMAGAAPAANDIVVSRRFDAPRELVWQAFTVPDHVAQWWGPRGFTTTTHQHDLRVGGVWLHTMHGPDGTDYPNRIRFREITPPQRILYFHDSPDSADPHHFDGSWEFTEEDGGTRLTMRLICATKEERDRIAEFGALEGGRQTLDRLGEHLAEMQTFAPGPPPAEFRTTRVFEAPRELVWRAWTGGELLARWWGPVNWTAEVRQLELRPGGLFHYLLTGAQGAAMWGRFVFREIVPLERLVFVTSFSDEQGGMTRAPFAGKWPLEMLTTVMFDEQDGRTTVMLSSRPLDADEEERRIFVEGYRSMTQGWGGSFERLREVLEEQLQR